MFETTQPHINSAKQYLFSKNYMSWERSPLDEIKESKKSSKKTKFPKCQQLPTYLTDSHKNIIDMLQKSR